MTTSIAAPADIIRSTFAGDADMRELIELFVGELPQRLADMTRSFDTGDWLELRRFAHQLKGASGSYGFGALTPAAAQLEQACKEPVSSAIRAALDELIDLCSRIRA